MLLSTVATLPATTDANGHYAIDSSAFNETGLTGGFSMQIQVNAPGFLGVGWSGSFGARPIVRDFNLP